MATLMAPGPTRPLPARLQRFGSAEDMRKEPSFPAPESLAQSSATPSPTPKPQRTSVTRPHGVVPTLQNMCIAVVQEGVLSGAYKRLEMPVDMLAELASRLQSKRLLNDENVSLFAPLTELVLSNCPITDKGLRSLFEKPESKSLVGLHLENTNITDNSLRLIPVHAPKLRLLDVSKCSQITDKGLSIISEQCTELRCLAMRDIFTVTDSVVGSALQLPHLIRLDLDGACRLTDGLVKRISGPGKTGIFSSLSKKHQKSLLATVEELSLGSTSLSATAIPSVTSLCPRLQTLNLSYCQQVSDQTLGDILAHTPSLEAMVLRATPAISDAILPALSKLNSLLLLENPQLTLLAIRKLVESSSVKVLGADTDVTLLRNTLGRSAFTVTVNEFDTAQTLLSLINNTIASEGCTSENITASYKLRRVTYRKNGTKRPGQVHAESEYDHLVRELIEKKHHMYLDQNPNSVLRLPGAPQTNDLFLTLRLWDETAGKPTDLRDLSLPSTMTLADLKHHLSLEGVLPCAPEKMFLVEEETDLRTNILATDAMSISMCGIISGDILHLEEITADKIDASNQVIKSHTGDYLASRPTCISVQETDDSFHRRRGRLTFLADSIFKFELKLKSSWSFTKLKNRIAHKVGVAPEYLKISTRVEPQLHLQGTTQPAIDVIGGNLWLLLEVDSTEMLSEKVPVVLHNFGRNGVCSSVQTILVRRTATVKGLKEKISEVTHIPEDCQLLSRLSSRDLAFGSTDPTSPTFVKHVYTQNTAKISHLNLHHIRVDEMDRPVNETDLILQVVHFGGWKSGTFKTVASTDGPVRLIALPAGSKFNEVKAAISTSSTSDADAIDMDTMTLKLAGSPSLARDLMFDIKPRYFAESSTVVATTLMRPLDIVCWSDSSF